MTSDEKRVAQRGGDDKTRCLEIWLGFTPLALFDRRVTVLLRRWTAAGAVDDSPVDSDMTNDAVAPILAALEPRVAAALCLAAAAEADAAVAALSPEMIAAIEQAMAEGRVFMRLDRGLHRAGHLADIEKAVGR